MAVITLFLTIITYNYNGIFAYKATSFLFSSPPTLDHLHCGMLLQFYTSFDGRNLCLLLPIPTVLLCEMFDCLWYILSACLFICNYPHKCHYWHASQLHLSYSYKSNLMKTLGTHVIVVQPIHWMLATQSIFTHWQTCICPDSPRFSCLPFFSISLLAWPHADGSPFLSWVLIKVLPVKRELSLPSLPTCLL